MRRILILFAACLLPVLNAVAARPEKSHVIGFYNVENLFDTVHDEGKNDAQYLPDGQYGWNQEKYSCKLHNIATVIKAIADENGGRFHTVLGLAEVENDNVLRDLVAQEEIAEANYSFVHFESPDARGIDVALLYRPDQFKVLESKAIPYTFESEDITFEMSPEAMKDFVTRDILMVRGKLSGEMFAFFVCHFPSRLGGKGNDLRCRAAEIVYAASRDLEREYPGIKIVVMGDMNDNPTDDSMTVYLHGRETPEQVAEGDFLSPFVRMLADGYGTLSYQGEWNIYDIILVNSNLVNPSRRGLRIRETPAGYYGYVFKKPFMEQQEGKFKGTPFRTFSYGQFINGYSDHYPTYIVISK